MTYTKRYLVVPPEVRAQIVAAMLDGGKASAVAAEFGVSKTTVSSSLKLAGVKLEPYAGRMRRKLDDAVRAAHDAGWPQTPTEVGRPFNVSRWAVYSAARRLGLPLRPLRGPRRVQAHPWSRKRNLEIRALYNEGAAVPWLAEQFDLSRQQITILLKD